MVNVKGQEIRLTKRQAAMLPLLERGMTYKEIGNELGISWMTVRCMLHLLYEKAGVEGPNARIRVVTLAKE